MIHTADALASNSRSTATHASFEEGMRRQIGALLNERDVLEEEVRQLRAAVKIYTEVVRRLELGAQRRAA
jgi:hypothetical protein